MFLQLRDGTIHQIESAIFTDRILIVPLSSFGGGEGEVHLPYTGIRSITNDIPDLPEPAEGRAFIGDENVSRRIIN